MKRHHLLGWICKISSSSILFKTDEGQYLLVMCLSLFLDLLKSDDITIPIVTVGALQPLPACTNLSPTLALRAQQHFHV